MNDKKYIGITIDFNRRIKQHINSENPSLIHKAIKKYGEENFIFEIIAQELITEEAEELEIETIKKENTLTPNGYNIAKGGLYGGRGIIIPDKDIKYIKEHRNIPLYLLYEQFSDKMSYGYFKQIYHNKVRTDIVPTCEEYSSNLEFSCQFTKSKLTYYDIIEIREWYKEKKDWRELYPKYKEKVSKSTFWEVFSGRSFSLIMPEVFDKEIKKERFKIMHSGENNGRSKLKKEDVIMIRRLYNEEKKTRKEISEIYNQISKATINDIIGYRTWKNI